MRQLSSSALNEDVLVQQPAEGVVTVTLNRPKALNALNLGMVRKLTPLYKEWESNASVKGVIMVGVGEKAFCAGGDVVAIYREHPSHGGSGDLTTFFREEYVLDFLIGSLSKPHIAILDGITMGGGVGLSVHGSYRVATEATMFAMPETAIGFFCDVGGSHFLPRLKDHLGMYLALTGARLKGREVFDAGIATHFVSREQVPALIEQLQGCQGHQDVQRVLHDASSSSSSASSLDAVMEDVSRCFSKDSVEGIIESLKDTNNEWASKALKAMEQFSPTSLKVVHEQLCRGREQDLDQNFKMEMRIATEFMRNKDFFEGVRAQLVDKDKSPAWSPSTLQEVTRDMVEKYFQPLPPDQELLLHYHSQQSKL